MFLGILTEVSLVDSFPGRRAGQPGVQPQPRHALNIMGFYSAYEQLTGLERSISCGTDLPGYLQMITMEGGFRWH